MFKKSKIALTVVLAMLLCAASFTSAFATNLDGNGALTGDENNPVEAAISKDLRLPTGTNVPSANFIFEVEAKTVDNVAFNPDAPNMPILGTLSKPGIGTFTLSFSQADASWKKPVTGLVNTDSIKKETGDIFAGVTFPHAGVFVYEVTERADTNEPIDAAGNMNEWLSYSGAKYQLTVYVEYKADGVTTFVYGLGTRTILKDDGADGDGFKVDPTPGGYGEEYSHSEMMFTNDYVRNNGPFEPEDAKSTLAISKQVAGDFASKEQLFHFTIDLMVPSIVPNPPAHYKAYLIDVNGSVLTPHIEVSTSTTTSFSLKHGQSLVFVDTPVGTGYAVTEAAPANYIPSVRVITGGGTPNDIPGVLNTALSTGNQHVGEQPNSAAFTNTRDSVTPTGLNLNDLPFILLIALGLGALTTFVVLKVRKGKQNYR